MVVILGTAKAMSVMQNLNVGILDVLPGDMYVMVYGIVQREMMHNINQFVKMTKFVEICTNVGK